MRRVLILFFVVWLGVLPVFVSAGDDAQAKQCQPFSVTDGYFFDNYEQHSYVNGLLQIHLKLKTPYNDGRGWENGIYVYKPDCSLSFLQLNIPNFAPRPGMQLYSIRFSSPSHFDFWDDELDVEFKCGTAVCGVDLPPDLAGGTTYGQFSYQGVIDHALSVVSGSLPIVQGQQAVEKDPVLIVPGILGTVLKQSATPVWPNLALMALDPSDQFMDMLTMNESGRPVNGTIVPDSVVSKIDFPFKTLDYTAGLIDEFKKQGYTLNQNLFLFPYDWRFGLVDNANTLKIWIGSILQQTAAQKLNVVAHSYGGLVVKEYLAENQDSKINNLVFVGVPHLGSAEAAHDLIFGSNLGIPILSGSEIQKLSQNMPSIYDLLPSKLYFQHSAGFYDDLSTLQTVTPLDYDQSKILLLSLGKNSELLGKAEADHDRLDAMDFSSQVQQIFNVVGCGQFTLKTISKMYEGAPNILQKLTHGPKYRISGDNGDGTVLVSSASAIPDVKNFYARLEHLDLLSDPSTAGSVVALALGNQSSVNLATDVSGCNVQGKLLSLNSALEINITDQITGKQIDPNTLYQVTTGDDQHLFLPTDSGQKYKIVVKPGSVKSPVNVSVTKILPAQTTIYNYSQINLQNQAVMQLTPNADTVDNIDSQGNDQNVPPTDVTDENGANSTGNSGSSAPDPAPVDNPVVVTNPSTPAYIPPPTPPALTPPPPPPIYILPPTPAPTSQPDTGDADTENHTSDNSDNSSQQADQSDNSDQVAVVPEDSSGPVGSASPVPVFTSSGQQPNINITFQNPQSGFGYQPGPAPQSVDQNKGETIIINQTAPAPYWNWISNILHLIFF